MSLAQSHGIHDLAATFVHDFLRLAGMEVRYRSDLDVPYAANSSTGRILLPPGLDWPDEHSRLDRCFLFLIGGAALAPEFSHTGPVANQYPGDVIPLLRRPW